MADRRPEAQDMSRAKRAKLEESDPTKNPYLAHMYENQRDESYSNGYANRSSVPTGLSKFKRHETTALQAHTAEDGPNNPFNNVPLSNQYFNILKTRRELPVHKQRYTASFPIIGIAQLTTWQTGISGHVPFDPDSCFRW